MPKKVSVLVAGSWGTAIASVLAENEMDVMLWTRNEQQAAEINTEHHNRRFLDDAALSPRIRATSSMEQALNGSDAVIVVAPSAAMRDVASQMRPFLKKEMILVHATKGFEASTLKSSYNCCYLI